MSERDEKGKFKEGHTGAGGRPAKAREQAILQIGREVATLEKWREIFQKAVDDAIKDEDGRTRDKARRFLAEYQIGKPAQIIKLHQGAEETDEFSDLSDEELRAIVAASESEAGASGDRAPTSGNKPKPKPKPGNSKKGAR